MRVMNSIQHIRKSIFVASQSEFAALAGVTQPTVSRWEAGSSEPTRAELDLIRSEAFRRGLAWDDGLFFMQEPAE